MGSWNDFSGDVWRALLAANQTLADTRGFARLMMSKMPSSRVRRRSASAFARAGHRLRAGSCRHAHVLLQSLIGCHLLLELLGPATLEPFLHVLGEIYVHGFASV
jgi:hypothetical protein